MEMLHLFPQSASADRFGGQPVATQHELIILAATHAGGRGAYRNSGMKHLLGFIELGRVAHVDAVNNVKKPGLENRRGAKPLAI